MSKKSKFIEEQITFALRRAEAGITPRPQRGAVVFSI